MTSKDIEAFGADIYGAVGNGKIIAVIDKNFIGYLGTAGGKYLSLILSGIEFYTEQTPWGVIIKIPGAVAEGIVPIAEITVTADPDNMTICLFIESEFDFPIKLKTERFIYSKEQDGTVLFSDSSRSRIYLRHSGRLELDFEESVIMVKAGISALYFRALSRENFSEYFPDRYIMREKLENKSSVSKNDEDPVIQKCRSLVSGLRSSEGGCLIGNGMMPLVSVIRALDFCISDGNKKRADDIYRFFYLLFDKYGALPLMTNADASNILPCNLTYNPAGDMFLIMTGKYLRKFKGSPSEKMLEISHSIALEDYRLVKGGMMMFSGTENCFTEGVMPSSFRFCGSSENTLRYIVGTEEYLEYAKDSIGKRNMRRYSDLLEYTVSSFDRNFLTYDGRVLLYNRSRDSLFRLPHMISGKCDACGKLTELENRKDGFFCKECFDGGKSVITEEDIGRFLTEGCISATGTNAARQAVRLYRSETKERLIGQYKAHSEKMLLHELFALGGFIVSDQNGI